MNYEEQSIMINKMCKFFSNWICNN